MANINISEQERLYNQFYTQHKLDGCRLTEAAALSSLIEHCIKNKTYVVYDPSMDHYDKFDVIVTFNFAGDPTFGVYRYDEDAYIYYPTSEGIKKRHL